MLKMLKKSVVRVIRYLTHDRRDELVFPRDCGVAMQVVSKYDLVDDCFYGRKKTLSKLTFDLRKPYFRLFWPEQWNANANVENVAWCNGNAFLLIAYDGAVL
ncbi:hypothetical protein EVAR_10589_1 [Eumeta japonica]|uniref:Uncharacterized protein n=1 Tax=Eumeta variegata TaxID=151549 RepID=A0A4C1U3C0_EUMVA|nr:hypothetical protein EVAR_10589_1 [Eumeta japonica]